MSTSAENSIAPHLVWNLAGTVFLALFGAVYEIFSHGVYSYFMIYAFAVPLVMGVVPYTLMMLKCMHPDRTPLLLWNSAIATFAVGSLFLGALQIYGTTNSLTVVYPIVGSVLAISALILFIRSVLFTPRPTL